MKLKTLVAFIGSLLGIAGIIVLYFTLGVSWLALAVIAAASLLGYILGAVGAAATTHTTGFGEFMRGFLIGMNAMLNAFLAFVFLRLFIDPLPSLLVGLGLGALTYLCVFAPISQNGFYQGLLGWLNGVLPMSWIIVALGFAFYLTNVLLHLVTLGRAGYLKIRKLDADWSTGTFFMKGGLISNLNPIDTAFNMGNFSFVDMNSSAMHIEHEAGHTLNLAAFGFLFHLIGALDENATGRGADAFSERIAESNDTGTAGSNIPMWSS